MGTMASLVVADARPRRECERAVDAAAAELARIEVRFSAFRTNSELSRFARGELAPDRVSEELRSVLADCRWLDEVSGGAFRIRRPVGARNGRSFVDVAGYVKGWAVERAGRVLGEAGLRHWLIDVGGDLRSSGQPEPGRPWRVAVRDPHQPGRVCAVLDASDLAVATSGRYERGDHLWDARTSPSAPGAPLSSFTVVGPDLTWADAFATAGWVMGLPGIDWVSTFEGYGAMAVLPDGRCPASAGFVSRLTPVAA
jgi:thiamine biosynthesis lipoprotein